MASPTRNSDPASSKTHYPYLPHASARARYLRMMDRIEINLVRVSWSRVKKHLVKVQNRNRRTSFSGCEMESEFPLLKDATEGDNVLR